MSTNFIRNIGIVAHVDAGKTTITEHMLFESRSIRSIGSVDRGTTNTDWMDIERERGISVRSAATSFMWKNIRINLIDTPGHVDFSAEVERSLRVLDGAVLVVSAVEGVQAQTEILWSALSSMNIPTIIFINKIDRNGSDVLKVLKDIRRFFTSNAFPVQIVNNEGSSEPEIFDLWDQEISVHKDSINNTSEEIVEFLAERDDAILEKYLKEQQINVEELQFGFYKQAMQAAAFPVLFGSALKGVGIRELLDAIISCIPSPNADSHAPLSGVIFKIEHDKMMGRVSYIRLYSGMIKNRDVVLNVTQNLQEKVTQIRRVYGQKHEDVGVLAAGDIASICGFGSARIGDIIGSEKDVPEGYRLAVPLLKIRVFPSEVSQYTALVSALQEISDEDPLLDMQWLRDEREIHVKVMGVIQLEVLSSLLKSRFNLDVSFSKPSVIYKETPSTAGEGFVSYTMPKPCWAVLRFKIEPGQRGSGVVYSSQVRDEDILFRYQNQVEKTIPESLQQGLYGWEVTDLKITLIEGEYHVMHTHPLDFIVATPMGILDGLSKTGTTLLEPVLRFRISVPEEIGGKVLGDIIQMRGSFDAPTVYNGNFTVEGNLPVSTSLDYPTRLGSISGGKGVLSTRFAGYQECPLELGATTPRRGVDPLDRSKYILSVRNALG